MIGLKNKVNDFFAKYKIICSVTIQLLKNYRLYIILAITLMITSRVSNDTFSIEGMKMVPTTIGVLFGGLIATVAILFGVIREEDLETLFKKYGLGFFNSLKRLKYHILLILIAFFATLFSFFITAPSFISSLLGLFAITELQLFYFLQIFFALLTLYSTIEVVNILFLVFEIKFTLIVNKENSKHNQPK